MDLQEPTAKMSKSSSSDAGIVYLTDPPATIMKKFKRAVTDSDNEVRYDRDTKPGIANLLDVLAACTGEKPVDLAVKYSQYGALKTDAGDAVVALLEPMQEKFKELREDRAELSRLLRIGGERARSVASATLARTYDAIGFARP
jgi:tryptophanyl-tRNA synthetase